MQQLPDNIKYAGDVAFLGITSLSLAEILPEVTALLSLIWVGLRIWETETVKRWTGRWPD